MEDKTNKYILGIVAIVAIVGIIIMVTSSVNTNNNNQYEDSIGYATKVANTNLKISNISNSTCKDTDNGYKYDIKGTISGTINGKAYKSTDYCIGNIELKEYACEKNTPTSVNYKCLNGCKDGACIKNQTNQTYNIITSDIKAITTGGTVLQNTFNAGQEVKIRPEISNIGDAPLFITLNSIKYTISLDGSILASNIPCGQVNTYLQPGQTIVCNAYTVSQLGYAGIYNISIHSDSDDRYPNENNNDNIRTETFTVTAQNTCTDSDGGINYAIAGYVFISGIEEITWDQCISSNTLNETYCNGNDLGTTYYSCPNGCYQGACIEQTTNTTCTDSDGGLNYNTFGNVTIIGGSQQGTYYDNCISGNILNERYCNATNHLGIDQYYCPNGCSNGRCQNQTINATCTDSDGGFVYNITGIVNGTHSSGTPYSYIDYCEEDNTTLHEYACNGTIPFLYRTYQCTSETCVNGRCINY